MRAAAITEKSTVFGSHSRILRVLRDREPDALDDAVQVHVLGEHLGNLRARLLDLVAQGDDAPVPVCCLLVVATGHASSSQFELARP